MHDIMSKLSRPALARLPAAAVLAALLACAAAPARAHVVLDTATAVAGSYFKANLRIGHGCGTSATRQVVVHIPAGVQGAKPRPKPGWVLEITREPLAQPATDHGRQVTDEVTRISWTARTAADMLPNEQFDEFAIHAKLPATAGPLYWKVNQVCEQGRLDWTEVPQPGQTGKDLKAPAAVLNVVNPGADPGDAHVGHKH